MDPTSLHLQWYPPDPSGTNGIIQYYNLTVIELETGVFSTLSVIETYITIPNLHPFYTYKCSVSAVTVGNGPFITVILRMPESGKQVTRYVIIAY